MLFAVLEVVVMVIVITIIVTQVFIPIYRGTTLWPFFKRERKLEHELHVIQQEIVEQEIEKKVEEARRRTKIRSVK